MISHIWVFLFALTSLLLSLGTATDVKLAEPGNTCPNGHSQITSLDKCRVAMELVHFDQSFNEVESAADWPRGCYYCSGVPGCTDGAWFNNHNTGSAKKGVQSYCEKDLSIVPGGVVFIGDSDIDYWDTNQWKPMPQSYNVGVGGRTCKDIFKENDWMLDSFKPSQVVLVCGENDIAGGKSVKNTFKDFKRLFSKLKKASVRVIYISTKPEPATTNLHTKYQKYDKKVKKYAGQLARRNAVPPLVMVDSFLGFKDLNNPKYLYASDKLHLSGDGYQQWKDWVQLAISDTDLCAVWRSSECKYAKPSRRLSLLV